MPKNALSGKISKEVYLDNAATTQMSEEVLQAMLPYLKQEYGNPGSFNALGMRARDAVDKARSDISRLLQCKAQEIIFTASGTESINLALKGIAHANKEKGNHIITTQIEHEAVLQTCRYLEKYGGMEVAYLGVDKYGMVDPAQVEKAIKKNTILISVMYANNEIGTIQPVSRIASIAKKHNIYCHTDACQAGLLDLNAAHLQADLLSLNGGKLNGPKGVGMLYRKTGIPLHPLIHGGGQEHNLRSGTENVAAIVGFAKALTQMQQQREQETKRLALLRGKLIKGIMSSIPNASLNGHPTNRLPGNVSVSFQGLDAESLLIALNERGICASAGSACTARKRGPSHVILATGMSAREAQGTIRFTLGRNTSEENIIYVLQVLPKLVKKLRAIG